MSGLIGKKIAMTSIFNEAGAQIPCTVIQAGPCEVTQVKTKANDGYESLQLAYEGKPERVSNKAERNHFKKAGTTPKRKVVEFRNFESSHELGSSIGVDIFQVGEFVDVSGTSKGKGFQGVVKRHGFAGVGQKTHGQHNRLRAPGSIGAASYPARVFKGMKMAGRMGGERVTVKNLQVVQVLPDQNLLIVKGAIPGHNNSFVTIQK